MLEQEILNTLQEIHESILQKRDPIDQTIMASSTQPWVVDYRNRKHIFLWFPTAQTVSFEDFGTGPVTAQVWMNIAMPPSTRMFITSSSALVEFMVRYTDEIIP